MSKIEELIDLISNATDEFYADGDQEFYRVDIERIMKEYAEWYALEYRSKILDECWTDDYGKTLISDTEILNIKLPNHE